VIGSNNWIPTGTATTALKGLTGTVFGSSSPFKNATGRDFTLAAGTTAIGAATSVLNGWGPAVYEYYENEVITSEYRVRLTSLDIGAFESTTTGPGINYAGSTAGNPSPTGSPSPTPTPSPSPSPSPTPSPSPSKSSGTVETHASSGSNRIIPTLIYILFSCIVALLI